MHLNLFDWVIADKSQFGFVFINPSLIKKRDSNNYWLQFSSWKDPQELETLQNYTLEKHNDKLKIIINDLFWIPRNKDSLNTSETKKNNFRNRRQLG
jgi:hypothetical protein